MLRKLRTKTGRVVALIMATLTLLVATAAGASAYSVGSGTWYSWDNYSKCYRMEHRTYHWYEDPFNNRDGWYPVRVVANSNCGRR